MVILSGLSVLCSIFAFSGCRYVALGDSVGWGDSYVNDVAEGTGADTTNLSVPWEWLPLLVHNVQNEPSYQEAIAAADFITVGIGGNDAMVAHVNCPDAACLDQEHALFLSAYGQLLDAIRTQNDHAIVVALDIYNPFGPSLDADTISRLSEMNAGIRDAACSRGMLAAHVFEAFNGADGAGDPGPLIGPDGLHPSPEGHRAIALAVLSAHCP